MSVDVDVFAAISPATNCIPEKAVVAVAVVDVVVVLAVVVVFAAGWLEQPAMNTPRTRINPRMIPYRDLFIIVVSFGSWVYKILCGKTDEPGNRIPR